MNRLRWRLAALLLWLTLFFNIERLDIDGRDTINIPTSVYVLGMLALFAAMSPAMSQRPMWHTALPAVLLYLAYNAAMTLSPLGSEPYVTLSSCFMLIATVVLAHRVGQELNAFVAAVESITFSNRGGRLRTMEEVEDAVQIEMSSSRRSQRPMSLVIIQLDMNGLRMMMHQLIQEIQRSMMQRYILATVGRIISRQLRRSDMVIEHDKPGRLILLTPETTEDQAQAIGRRLQQLVQERMGVGSYYSTAAFPEQALTFEDLLDVAESRLYEQQPLLSRSSDPEDRLLARAEQTAQEMSIANANRREAESARA